MSWQPKEGSDRHATRFVGTRHSGCALQLSAATRAAGAASRAAFRAGRPRKRRPPLQVWQHGHENLDAAKDQRVLPLLGQGANLHALHAAGELCDVAHAVRRSDLATWERSGRYHVGLVVMPLFSASMGLRSRLTRAAPHACAHTGAPMQCGRLMRCMRGQQISAWPRTM